MPNWSFSASAIQTTRPRSDSVVRFGLSLAQEASACNRQPVSARNAKRPGHRSASWRLTDTRFAAFLFGCVAYNDELDDHVLRFVARAFAGEIDGPQLALLVMHHARQFFGAIAHRQQAENGGMRRLRGLFALFEQGVFFQRLGRAVVGRRNEHNEVARVRRADVIAVLRLQTITHGIGAFADLLAAEIS